MNVTAPGLERQVLSSGGFLFIGKTDIPDGRRFIITWNLKGHPSCSSHLQIGMERFG